MSQSYASRQITSQVSRSNKPWVRPSDWLALPSVSLGENKIVLLVAVFEHANNFLAFNIAGKYTVDWGDGSSPENVNSGVTAQHALSWAGVDPGSLCSRGYRQAIVTITPRSGEQFTTINFGVRHSTPSTRATDKILDMRVSAPSCASFTMYSGNILHAYLERFEWIGSSAITYFADSFRDLFGLRNVVGTAFTSSGSNFSNMFYGCSSLSTIPLLDTSSGTNFSSMFGICYSLSTIPLLDTSSGSNFSSMFYGCSSLSTIPLLDTSSGSNFSSMFYNCYSLSTIPLLDTSSGTNFSNMFYNCYSLSTIPLLDTSSGTNFSSMFSICYSLEQGALSGTRYNISYQNCSLSGTALDDIYTNLGTPAGGSQTITVTGNFGTTSDTPSIATGKGWTVTGS